MALLLRSRAVATRHARGTQYIKISPSIHTHRCFSTSQKNEDPAVTSLKIREVSSSSSRKRRGRSYVLPFRTDTDNTTASSSSSPQKSWQDIRIHVPRPKEDDPSARLRKSLSSTVTHLLPADYPHSVAAGYLPFTVYGFVSSVAGSAAMVLSTQTLLLAVGVVGQSSHAPILAGALNWVLKDGIGQLGGVLFASYMGKTRSIDADPKRWRVWAALALDGATLLELTSPMVPGVLLLPVASLAMVFKNIGFLTSSASRAALHQSLAKANNLGDVTAKSVSQSIAGSVVGTGVGIGITTGITSDPNDFMWAFVFLAALRQGSVYTSLKYVPLEHFNRHRLHLALTRYLDGADCSPASIASEESFLPGNQYFQSDNEKWLSIGAPLKVAFDTPMDLSVAIGAANERQQKYLLSQKSPDDVHLIFYEGAPAEEMVRGMYHAYAIRYDSPPPFDDFLKHVQDVGWKMETDGIVLEHRKAYRIRIDGD